MLRKSFGFSQHPKKVLAQDFLDVLFRVTPPQQLDGEIRETGDVSVD